MNYERNLIAACLRDVGSIDASLAAGITIDHFSNLDLRKLFQAILQSYRKFGGVLSENQLTSALANGWIREEADKQRMSLIFYELAQMPPTTDPVSFFIEEVHKVYLKNDIISTLKSAANLVTTEDLSKVIDLVKTSSANWTIAAPGTQAPREFSLGDGLALVETTYLDRKNNPTRFGGLGTGFFQVDQHLGGLEPGHVALLIGGQKSGKSIYLVNLALNAIRMGKRVLFIVNEGGVELVYRRIAALAAGINLTGLVAGKLDEQSETKFRNTVASYQSSKLLQVCQIDPAICTTSVIHSKFRKYQQQDGKFDLVLVDLLGLMESDSVIAKKQELWKKLGTITLELKSFALTENVPLWTVHHANREGRKKKSDFYDLSDISNSDEISRWVDHVFSWKAIDQDQLDYNHIGDIKFKLVVSRHCGPFSLEMMIDLEQVTITEKQGGMSVNPSKLPTQGY